MNDKIGLISGIGIGAGLMYMLDPERGNRRRAMMRDKIARGINKAEMALDTTSRDIRNRAQGVIAEAKSMVKRDGRVSDEVLIERVRSKMGRMVSHPHSIQVTANRGRVTLSGPILESEVTKLVSSISRVRGVTGVENRLEVHQRGTDVPGLQGGTARPGDSFELMQANWSPAARLLIGGAGVALMGYCARRRDAVALTAGTLGFGLFARALTNAEFKRLVGAGGRRGIDIRKIINIAAPVERVFDFWIDCENFPRFMRNVREVRKTGDQRYHWTVAGPAGVSVEWDAEITKIIPNEVLAWKSVQGSTIEHSGSTHFESDADGGGTRLTIDMSYNPPAGMLGHALTTVLGANPKREIDEDLIRMKTIIETGIVPRHAAKGDFSAAETSDRLH